MTQDVYMSRGQLHTEVAQQSGWSVRVEQVGEHAENMGCCRAIGYLGESLGDLAKGRGQLTASVGT